MQIMICPGFARANPEHPMEILKDPDTEGLTILADLLRHSVVSIRFTAQTSKYIQRFGGVPVLNDIFFDANSTLSAGCTVSGGFNTQENLYSAVASVLAYIFKIERGEETDYPDFEIPENMNFDEYGKTIK